ncbi:MAG: sigma-70 domain-containing protein, partial [Nocardioidaceae bacterium]
MSRARDPRSSSRFARSSAWSRPFSRAIGSATAALTQQLGRSPTVAELAERIGTGKDEVLKGLASAGAYST